VEKRRLSAVIEDRRSPGKRRIVMQRRDNTRGLFLLMAAGILFAPHTGALAGAGADGVQKDRGGSFDLVVVEQGAGRVTLIDGATGATRGSVKIGSDPHEVAVSRDGRRAYVSNFGLSDKDRAVGIAGESVSVVDLTTMTEVRRLDTLPHKAPHGVKIRPGTSDHVYANVEEGDLMLVFDGATGKVLRQFAVPHDTHNFVFSPAGNDLFLMAAASGVWRVDPATGATRSHFTSASAIRGLAWTADGAHLLASGKNELLWLDPATLAVTRRITDLGVGQILYSAMTPDSKYVLAPCAFDQKVLVIDVARGAAVATLATGKDPIAVQIAPDGRHAYVSNASDDHLSVIDLDGFNVRPFGVANMPNGLTFRPRTP
jgi:DNA-binding beta-propeller fold protein YncE